MDSKDVKALIADEVLRRALASDIARELLRAEAPLLRPLIKEIVMEVVIFHEAIATVERCKRVIDLFARKGFRLVVTDNGRLSYSKGKLPDELKAVFSVHCEELLHYLRDQRDMERARQRLWENLDGGSGNGRSHTVQGSARPPAGPARGGSQSGERVKNPQVPEPTNGR